MYKPSSNSDPHRTIIAGSRSVTTQQVLDTMSKINLNISVVLSGCARGADLGGEVWAEQNGIPIEKYPADWNTHGKAAGPIRNEEMAKNADLLILVWDGKSRGSRHMLSMATKYDLPTFVVVVDNGDN